MTTTISQKPPPALDGERRFLIRGVGWEGYQSLLKMVGDQPIRLTYDRGDVELMSPLLKHERKKSLLGQFVRILARELHIPVMPAGSTTWSREDMDKGLEADESFYLGDLERVRDPDHVDLDVDPPPDLAIEIEITRSALDRMGIYGSLGVPELWRFNGRTLRVLIRQADGSYQENPASAVFADVPMDEIARFATSEASRDENACVDQFWAWVREDLLPRIQGRGDA
ncbi:MAG: Uma2 family endonuclease [Isosphaerales bacterium]